MFTLVTVDHDHLSKILLVENESQSDFVLHKVMKNKNGHVKTKWIIKSNYILHV